MGGNNQARHGREQYGESIPDVIGRIGSTLSNLGADGGGSSAPRAGRVPNSQPADDPDVTAPRSDLSANSSAPDQREPRPSTEATATDRTIPLEATVSDAGRVSRLALDPYWLSHTDHVEVERALIRVLNQALDEHTELENERIRSADVGAEAVMKNLLDLQQDVQRAYERDLNRVTEPLRRIEAANRQGQYQHGERGQ